MVKYTPMIEQYLSVKAQVKDAFLFFRLGDFYELFFDDAIRAAKELEITLTGREGGAEERIPMCGVPYHSADAYIAKLVEKGYKVAICEQVEDPALAKGVVRREIVRIVTPGTWMDNKFTAEAKNNFLISIVSGDDGFGLAACDLSTGELHATVLESSSEPLIDELHVYMPSEIIAQPAILKRLQDDVKAVLPNVLCNEWTRADEQLLVEQFPAGVLSSLQGAARQAVAQMIAYLHETQKRALSHITGIRMYENKQHMVIDPYTRRNLELVETVLERSKKGSVLWLLDHTVTSMGARLLRRWIDKPLIHKTQIEERLEAVQCLYHQLITREEIRSVLKDVYDLERLVARIAYGNANARDMIALRDSLMRIPPLRRLCLDCGSQTLAVQAGQMDECADIGEWIGEAIVETPPVSVREGGMIRPGYHAYLDQLREASVNGKQWIAELEKKEREATGVKSLKVGFNKVFGYYIEVTRANLSSLPAGRYERKQTLANAERFITPELKEKELLILEAEDKMVDLEYELFVRLRDKLAAEIPRLQELARRVAAVDALQSLAAVSAANRYCRPEISEDYDLHIEEGRHPVVEAVMKQGAFIANDTQLSAEDGRILLITGPNMAGKSTYMRQVAIICLMGQIGCFVPARQARLPIIDRIFTRIGAADDLIGGQSTFMVEMMDIQLMTAKATERSLVIIDELGRGTSTGEGMAIAQAVIEYLHNQVGCKTLVSTHFHELAELDQHLRHLRNYCMAVKESDQQVTFLRKLIPGAADTSYGIYCARIAGLPEPIIARAYELLHLFETNMRALEETATALDVGQAAADCGNDGCPVIHPNAGNNGAVQLSLFETGEDVADNPSAKGKNRPAVLDSTADKISRRIKSVDLINMTPLQAINFIYELKQQIENKNGE